MNNSPVASFHDNSAHGEDTFLTRALGGAGSLDAVLDGVTHSEGGYASSFTAQVLQDAPIEGLSDLIAALEQANDTLFEKGRRRNPLTTVSAALRVGDELHVVSVGDSPAYLVRDGEARELTTILKFDLLPGSLASGAIGQREKLAYEHKSVGLQSNDRLILATDGLANNVSPEELAALIQSSASPDEAVSALAELVSEKRRLHRGREDRYGTFREDDRTAIIRYFA